MSNRRTLLAAVLTAAFLLPVSGAFADIMTYDGLGFVDAVTLHADGLLADGKTVKAGQYRFTYQDTPHNAFCVDIDQWAGTTEVVEWTVDALHNGELVAFLHESYAAHVADSLGAASLGVAIWEVLYETDGAFDAGEGEFHISNNSAVRDAANDLLATLPSSYTPTTALTVLHSECKQDMLISSFSEVPEPATAALLVMGAGLIALRRRSGR